MPNVFKNDSRTDPWQISVGSDNLINFKKAERLSKIRYSTSLHVVHGFLFHFSEIKWKLFIISKQYPSVNSFLFAIHSLFVIKKKILLHCSNGPFSNSYVSEGSLKLGFSYKQEFYCLNLVLGKFLKWFIRGSNIVFLFLFTNKMIKY